MHRHTHPWKRWPNWSNYDSNWLLTHRILQTWPPVTIICSQTSRVVPGKEIHIEWGSQSGNRSVFRRLRHFVLQKGHRNVGKSLYQVYHLRRQLCWGINITLPKKLCLFSLKIPGLFSLCSICFCYSNHDIDHR